MTWHAWAVKAMVLFAVAAAACLVVLPVLGPTAAPATVIVSRTGEPLRLPTEASVVPATWQGQPILVFVVPQAILDGVDAQRGDGQATPSLAAGDDLRVFALSAKSTESGCLVAFNRQLGASKDIEDYDGDGTPDGRILDPCHHGQWDAYHRATPLAGTPAKVRLAVLSLGLKDGILYGSGYDGPVGRLGAASSEGV